MLEFYAAHGAKERWQVPSRRADRETRKAQWLASQRRQDLGHSIGPIKSWRRRQPVRDMPGLGDEICAWIAEGNSLSAWSRENNVSETAIYRWLREDSEFAQNYRRAREDATDTLVDRLMDIVDSEKDVQKAKLKCDNIKWVASRMKPNKYGDRQSIEHTGKGGGPIDINDSERAARVAALLDRARARGTRSTDSE